MKTGTVTIDLAYYHELIESRDAMNEILSDENCKYVKLSNNIHGAYLYTVTPVSEEDANQQLMDIVNKQKEDIRRYRSEISDISERMSKGASVSVRDMSIWQFIRMKMKGE